MVSAFTSTIPLLLLTLSLYHSQLLNNTGSSSNIGSNGDDSGRLLSIFSVVKFHHSECVSGTSTGLCMATEEVSRQYYIIQYNNIYTIKETICVCVRSVSSFVTLHFKIMLMEDR